jgi:hypothetical protein
MKRDKSIHAMPTIYSHILHIYFSLDNTSYIQTDKIVTADFVKNVKRKTTKCVCVFGFNLFSIANSEKNKMHIKCSL